ncbi:MAG: hypothetical protein HA488_01655 [Candidatus Verstraetearchaeota archaeon]|uniref:hypothetical protein n=1 Tax=Candidatus Culexarchaeum yellowstonense TaxID=2928963 RepID=UPI0017DAD401|nr:hypothetical protein [Candidatus Culexarchaeum yellowstonense]MCC6017616.1 hypothetical protein [Candidatus Verstraetearchaeota archaeon]MCR6623356.1 hypothetical protein [Candidatus Culexarchaeum yellowstonense]MCR6690995.1 hypothetical protein [Candidatus Culexarchaeum yellowstonense]MCS7367083.1 hypothetical protein [Candidatus Culexarchaeum yellowstonense]NHV11907.1 hypothetical protein [Candidatus Verstraetearchaeota archaeon]
MRHFPKDNKRKRGSPLLEEGLLIALAVITMSVVFSMVLGILDGVQKVIQNLGFNTQNFMNSLNDLWNKIVSFLGLGG